MLLFPEIDDVKKDTGCQDSCQIKAFVTDQVLARGLDERTKQAYEMDLELLYSWLRKKERDISDEGAIRDYLEYLLKEKQLKISTITRKYRVFRYYLKYLVEKGVLSKDFPIVQFSINNQEEDKADHLLTRREVDSFFHALDQEYQNLDSAFRRRVCLRDNVMMKLLFYHGIEVSELLKLELSDYNRKTGNLFIQGKKRRIEHIFSTDLKCKLESWIDDHGYFERSNEHHNILFLSKIGKPLSMKMVILVFNKYQELAGIEKNATPKDLKHSVERYARELLEERCS